MRSNPDHFDAFYQATRDRLLLQTYALTGDLPASRNAVRDAYAAAWHHWRKVSREADPESWVRPRAWADAQRRHTARIWHRDKRLDPEVRATLDALGKLSSTQRRVLLLNHSTTLSMTDMAREVGVPRQEAERALQSATATYAAKRDVPSTAIAHQLAGLATGISGARLPRASIIRRAGTTRRRLFTTVGVGAVLVALVGGGMFVTEDGGVSPNLSEEQVVSSVVNRAEPMPPRLLPEEMLAPEQLRRLDPRGEWQATEATANAEGDGVLVRCQGARFADPAGAQSLVRVHTSPAHRRSPRLTVVQTTELSRDTARAKRAYDTVVDWYAGCTTPRTQLLAAYRMPGVGDDATLLQLRGSGPKPSLITVGVARSGQIVTTTTRTVADPAWLSPRPVGELLAAAVNRLCGSPGSGTCAGPPTPEEAAPPPIGDAPSLLDVVDLPQPGRVTGAWTGTEPRQAVANVTTAIACDTSDFSAKPVRRGMVRSFLVLRGDLPRRFGITESVGLLPSTRSASTFVDRARTRMASCEDRDPASTVDPILARADAGVEIAAWRVLTEINDDDTIDMQLVLFRRGRAVGQLVFVTAPGASFDEAQLLGVARRAADRLAYLPGARG